MKMKNVKKVLLAISLISTFGGIIVMIIGIILFSSMKMMPWDITNEFSKTKSEVQEMRKKTEELRNTDTHEELAKQSSAWLAQYHPEVASESSETSSKFSSETSDESSCESSCESFCDDSSNVIFHHYVPFPEITEKTASE